MNEVSAIIGFSSSADTVSLGHFRLCATAASRPRLSAEVRRLEFEHVVLLRLHVIGSFRCVATMGARVDGVLRVLFYERAYPPSHAGVDSAAHLLARE